MLKRWSILVVSGLLITTAQAEAQFAARTPPMATGEDFHVELGIMFWSPTPELTIGSAALSGAGIDEVDFVAEFGIEKKRVNEYRVVLRAGRKHKIRYSYVPFRYDETAQLQRTVTFNGQTFPINVTANAKIDWQLWRFGYEWDFVSTERAVVGFVTELKYNKVSADVSAGGTTAVGEVKAPVPTLGIIGRGYVHRTVSITAEFTGLKLPGYISDRFKGDNEEFDVDFRDFDIYVTASFTRFLGVQGGYRSITADYVIDDDVGNLAMKGVYFGGLVRF